MNPTIDIIQKIGTSLDPMPLQPLSAYSTASVWEWAAAQHRLNTGLGRGTGAAGRWQATLTSQIFPRRPPSSAFPCLISAHLQHPAQHSTAWTWF